MFIVVDEDEHVLASLSQLKRPEIFSSRDLPPVYRPTAARIFPVFSTYSLGVRPDKEPCGLASL